MKWFPLAVGNLDPYVEHGTKNLSWAVHDNTLPGYHGLTIVRPGDFLRVLDDRHDVVWEGCVAFDYQVGYEPFDDDPAFGCQMLQGQRINGVQEKVDPSLWASWFNARHRAVLFRPANEVTSTNLSPIVQAVANLPAERWAWRAPQRFFEGMRELSPFDQHRIIADLQPAVAWIAHALGWEADQVAQSLDIPLALAREWAAPANLPWHRLQPADPSWDLRGAYLLALYGHLHWALGDTITERQKWPALANDLVTRAARSFDLLQEAVAELTPDPDLIAAPA